MAEIIAVINQKGGTAKTTTSVNISACLAEKGNRVLLVDMDPQGDAGLGFGIHADQLETSMFSVLVQGLSLKENIYSTNILNLDLAPGGRDVARTDINLADQEDRHARLLTAIECVRDIYDYIIIDCPPSFGLLPLNALVAAQQVLIPMAPQYFSLEGLKQVMISVRRVRESYNPSLQIAGILFCLVDKRNRMSRPSMDMVKAHFPGLVLKTKIKLCPKLNESNIAGKPVIYYASHSHGAQDYRSASKEIEDRFEALGTVHKNDRLGYAIG